MTPPQNEGHRWWALHRDAFAVFGLIVALSAIGIAVTHGYVMDDAFITLRYAFHFGTTGRYAWNPPGVDAPVLGTTSLLWTLMASGAAVVVRDREAMVPAIRVLECLVLAAIAWVFAARIARLKLGLAAKCAVAAAIFGQAGWGFHVNSAMDTLLGALTCLLVVRAVERRAPYPIRYGLAAIAFLARPEALVIGPLLAAFDLARGRRREASLGLSIVAIAVAIVAALLTVRFGTPLPLSWTVKHGLSMNAAIHAAFFVGTAAAPYFFFSAVGAVRRKEPGAIVGLAIGVTYTVGLLVVRPYMDLVHRFHWAALTALQYGSLTAVDTIARATLRRAGALLFALDLRTSVCAFVMAAENGPFEDNLAIVGRALARHPIRGRLALNEAGAMPFYSDLPTIDLGGLNDRAIAAGRISPEQAACGDVVGLVLLVGPASSGKTPNDDPLVACGLRATAEVPLAVDADLVLRLNGRDAEEVDRLFREAVTDPTAGKIPLQRFAELIGFHPWS